MSGIANSKRMRLIAFGYDIVMALIAMFLALLLRYGNLSDVNTRNVLFGAVIPFTGAAAASFLVMKTYCTSWRHASTTDLVTIFYTTGLAVLFYLPASFVVNRLSEIPRTSIVLAWMILLLLMGGSRLGYRLYRERHFFLIRRPMSAGQLPILVIGDGNATELFLRSLDQSSEYYPVGILSDGPQGVILRGIPILGVLGEVESVVESFGDAGDRPRKLVVVDRDLTPAVLNRLVEAANRLGLTIARGPDLTSLRPGMQDEVVLNPISVEDLLGRPQVVLDPAPVKTLIKDRRVLVTGAGGSIGSEIVRQVCAIGPSAVCLVDASEFNLYTVDATMSERWPETERVARVIDVRHRNAVQACFSQFKPEIVFHAAALKHVPLVEANPLEGVWTNTIGSRHICDAAAVVGCRTVVLVSTDKAVNPTNVMGASKRGAESYCQALGLSGITRAEATRFIAVRFGNVLGSTGSVVPLFERQLKAGGPVTVTHPEVERFFMSIREAVQLVLQASALGTVTDNMQGRVFVLDMGEPVRIVDLARQMIRLAGLRPDIDISITYSGLRPGEKLYEELSHSGEEVESTLIPRISVVSPRTGDLAGLREVFSKIEDACVAGRTGEVLELLRSLVPEFQGKDPSPHESSFGVDIDVTAT